MSSKPKVLHFIWWIPHYRVPIFRRLSQNKHIDFEVCAGDNSEMPDGAKVASASEVGNITGVNWRYLKSRRIRGLIFKDFEWQTEAVKVALRENIDVVINLGYQSLSNWLVRLICKLKGIPIIEWTHGVVRPEKGFRWFVRKHYYKWAKAFLLYGNFARAFFVEHGFKPEQIFVVNNSLDFDKQVDIRNRITEDKIGYIRQNFGVTNPNDRLIFHSGRLEKKKNLSLLINALSEMKQRGRNIVLILIGSGREEDNLRNQVKRNGITNNVIFYGSCYSEEEIGGIISASDLCVVPGAVGLIAMHSLVYGTPILTCENTNWRHFPEIEAVIEGKTGRFFEDENIEDLVEKMEQMLYPVPCKNQMSEACKDIIDNYYTPEYQERVIIKALNYVLPQDKKMPVPQ
jgi:glycosyltransferase involved in cell wall biosynthesis